MNETRVPSRVHKTKKGITINMRHNGKVKVYYYQNGNYPPFPKSDNGDFNWYWDLQTCHKPDRIYNKRK